MRNRGLFAIMTAGRPLILFALSLALATAGCSKKPTQAGGAQSRDCVSRKALTNVRLIMAAELGRIDVMDSMIKSGADVNVSDDFFGTPVVAAATSGNYDAVKLLLNNGASVNAMNAQGYTALMVATRDENVELVRRLLTDGADPNFSQTNRNPKVTALSIAKSLNNVEIIKLLTDAGAKE